MNNMQIRCKFSDTIDFLSISSYCSAFSQIRKDICPYNKGQPFLIKCKHSFYKCAFSGYFFTLFYAGNMLLSVLLLSLSSLALETNENGICVVAEIWKSAQPDTKWWWYWKNRWHFSL